MKTELWKEVKYGVINVETLKLVFSDLPSKEAALQLVLHLQPIMDLKVIVTDRTAGEVLMEHAQ